jgi:hypothetical protein
MVHRTLTPSVLMETERRTHMLRDTAAFLQQHDFRPLPVASAPACVALAVGDRLYVHATRLFAVLIQLPRGEDGRPQVRVGQSAAGNVHWNKPTVHRSEREAVLDACKLAQAFSSLICGGD